MNSPSMIYFGVDPGLHGGISAIHGDTVSTMAMPLTESAKDIDVQKLVRFILNIVSTSMYTAKTTKCLVEKVGAMPGNGVSSMFRFGFVTGKVEGVFQALEIPVYRVIPQTWKKKILAGTKKDKLAAIEFCQNFYPDVNLLATSRSKIPHTGIADSLCLAIYAMVYSEGMKST